MSPRVKVLIAGVCGLTLMLGVARFAYTPMLPLLQDQTGLSDDYGAWLAAINYLGYLSGVLIAALISDMALKDRLYRIGIVLAIVTTLMMALSTNLYLWGISRYLAGLSSAAGLILGSGLVLNWLIRHHFKSELGVHFSGIGVGILASALIVELSRHWFDWQEQWLWLTVFGLLLAFPAWRWLPKPVNSGVTVRGETLRDHPPAKIFLRIFMVAYFCTGVGFVISATFIVAIIDEMPGLTGAGTWVFMLIGLSAVPACAVWDRVARATGPITALAIAAILHFIGIALPLSSDHLIVALISAVLFGTTFVGIVSLVLTMAGRYYPTRPAKMMGKMTFSYGIGQIAAPVAVAVVAGTDGGYGAGIYMASGAMIVGIGLIFWLKHLERTGNEFDTTPEEEQTKCPM